MFLLFIYIIRVLAAVYVAHRVVGTLLALVCVYFILYV